MAAEAASPVGATAGHDRLRRQRRLVRAAVMAGVALTAAMVVLLIAPAQRPRMPAPVFAPTAGDVAAVLPVQVADQPEEWAWLRLGLMDLIAARLRSAGLAVVPSDNVVALVRERDAGAGEAVAVVTAGTGARTLVLPAISRTAAGWTVQLTLHTAAGAEHEVEAHDPDAIAAARTAADRLLARLGRRAPGTEAGNLPPDELLSRAEAALLTDDLNGARDLLERAPAAMQTMPELRLRLAQVDYRAGRLAAAGARLDTLLGEVRAESSPVLRARVLNGAGAVAIGTRRPAAGERAFAEAVALLENRNQPAALGQAYTGLAVSRAAQGHYDAALADFSRARVALELAGDALALARVEENEGIVAAKRGHYAGALAAHLRAAQRFERFGALNERISTLANAAGTQLALLQPADALATVELALPLLERLENRNTHHALQMEHVSALAHTGRLTAARALLAELANDASRDVDPALLAARIHFERAALDFDAGRLDSAAALAAAATAEFDNDDYQRERAAAWLLLTRALRAQGKAADAATETAHLTTWASARATAPMPVYAALAQAEQAWSERKPEAARVAYDDALARAAKDDVPADTAEVVVSYGSRLIAAGELERASAVVGLAARWVERDFRSALLQARYYRALGERDAWRAALQRAQSLAGERPLPAALAQPPDATPVSARLR